jgi:16S rRNA (adenine1518-N6/adenine1519-N6)-dimethyltransferase
MQKVKAKKELGQHFLNDLNIASKIVAGLDVFDVQAVIEVGPGMGVLSKFLFEKYGHKVHLLDIDTESIEYLHQAHPQFEANIIYQDFLKYDFNAFEKCVVIGNFPYNISSQIVFKILDERNRVEGMVGMFQKEVAEMICAKPNSKVYGILSVLTQAFYETEYLFTVNAGAFNPPPKVKSGVMRMTRKQNSLDCNEKRLFEVVKMAFNQRRKMLRNALSGMNAQQVELFMDKRAENLSVSDFVELTKALFPNERA